MADMGEAMCVSGGDGSGGDLTPPRLLRSKAFYSPKATQNSVAPSAPRKATRDETRSLNLRDQRGDEAITADLIRRLIDRTREDYVEMLWDAIESARIDLSEPESDGGGISR